MPVVTPKVVTEVVTHLRELSDSGFDPRSFTAQMAGPSLLQIADDLEANQDWSGRAAHVLYAEQSGWIEIRGKAEKEGNGAKVQEAKEKLRQLGKWISDLHAMFELMTD